MFITEQDFNTHIYAELVTAISRDEDGIFEASAAAAEQEAKGYLSRYDTDTLFAETEGDRDPALLMRVKDIAAWHFISLGNADINLELRKTRYDEAKAWLKDVQAGKVSMKEWPLPAIEAAGDNDIIKVSSRPRRETNY